MEVIIMHITKQNITNKREIENGEYKTVINCIDEKTITTRFGRELNVLEFKLSVFIDEETIEKISILHFMDEKNDDYVNFTKALFDNYSTNDIDFDNHANTVVLATIFKNDNGYYVLKSYKPFIESSTKRVDDLDDIEEVDFSKLTID